MRRKNNEVTSEIQQAQYSFNRIDKKSLQEEEGWKELNIAAGLPDDTTMKALTRVEDRSIIKDQLGHLRPRWRQVLEMRYGLIDGIEFSVEEIASYLNVTAQRVQQIERKSLKKLSNIISK